MDTAHWSQFQGNGGVVKQVEGSREGGSSSSSKGNGNNNGNNSNNNGNMLERKARPQKDQALNCPRCNSTNTKFCYYNNYSLSQPRYFCKACRRYWTNGGSLRNVPVGGGSRKNKRSSLSSSSSSSSADKKINGSDQNPKVIHHVHQDLNLAIFPPNTSLPSSADLGSFMTAAAPAVANGGGMFGGGGGGGGGGFGLHEMKPSVSFSLEGFENNGGYGDFHHQNQDQDHEQDQTAVMFPIEDLKQSNGAAEFEQNRGGGYWNGMLGGGSW